MDDEGDANIGWRLHQPPVTTWGGDLYCPHPLPMFSIALGVQEGQLVLVPSLEEVSRGVMAAMQAVVSAAEALEDVGLKVKNGEGEAPISGFRF